VFSDSLAIDSNFQFHVASLLWVFLTRAHPPSAFAFTISFQQVYRFHHDCVRLTTQPYAIHILEEVDPFLRECDTQEAIDH
jgi:hypothetical protein